MQNRIFHLWILKDIVYICLLHCNVFGITYFAPFFSYAVLKCTSLTHNIFIYHQNTLIKMYDLYGSSLYMSMVLPTSINYFSRIPIPCKKKFRYHCIIPWNHILVIEYWHVLVFIIHYIYDKYEVIKNSINFDFTCSSCEDNEYARFRVRIGIEKDNHDSLHDHVSHCLFRLRVCSNDNVY